MTKATDNWLAVDRKGLAQVLARRSKGLAICELISNAWDEPGVTTVKVRISTVPNRPEIALWVEDDAPDGFADLEEARVMFSPSKKKGEATQRGRFNVGEKLFLALCIEAQITSKGGSIEFLEDGTVKRSRRNREDGTEVFARMRMTREELREALDELSRLLPPTGITTTVESDGEVYMVVDPDAPLRTFKAKLQTELADDEGNLRPTQRTTDVKLYSPVGGESGYLYEMGIPVMPLELPYLVNVGQKIPLTIDRESVKPAFLQRLQGFVLNAAADDLLADEITAPWVTEAMAQPHVHSAAIETTLDKRFGPKRVSYDPSDPEANSLATSKGYTVIHGGSLPRAVWDRVREVDAVRPAGQVTPSNSSVAFSETGEDVTVPESRWKIGGEEVVRRFHALAFKLLGTQISISIVNDRRGYRACYGDRRLLLNARSLGWRWFADGATRLEVKHLDLLLHELGHHYAGDHLSSEYHDALTRLGAILAVELAARPEHLTD